MPRSKRDEREDAEETMSGACTYDLGYVRQDLYACRKCMREGNGSQFGFCAGCRKTCHSKCGNSVIELYTKRSFRCDCGNSRAGNTCQLRSGKDDVNELNEGKYSHNFKGRYCRCDQAYNGQFPMVQCAMCEDWFHVKCFKLKRAVWKNPLYRKNQYELTCKECVSKVPILGHYLKTLTIWNDNESRREWANNTTKRVCNRPICSEGYEGAGQSDLLWMERFRERLCRCDDCMVCYRDANALYLVDRTDLISTYSDKAVELEEVEEIGGVESAPKRVELQHDFSTFDILGAAKHTKEKVNDKSEKAEDDNVDGENNPGSGFTEDYVDMLRVKLNKFLRANVTNSGELPRTSDILMYLKDMRTMVVNDLYEK